MGRVLTNLVGNATKFTERGRVQISAAQSQNGGLVVAVKDTGPGVPVDQVDRIFDEFAQLQNPERDRDKGSGLGLAICRRLVQAVGGSLSVESSPGAGSTFSAWYPPDHLPANAPLITDKGSPVQAPQPPLDAPILLVEDDPQSRRALAELLCRAGFRVEVTTDGALALAALDRVRPSLILLDLLMPGLDGLEFVRRLRARPEGDVKNLPVVVISGVVDDPERLAQLSELHVHDHVPKPINFDNLLELVGRYAKLAHR
jgi:CheY-like chemotaxis protein